jgi:hypothetical protein
VKYRKKQVEVEAIRFNSVDDLAAKGIAYRMPANPSGPNFSVQVSSAAVSGVVSDRTG